MADKDRYLIQNDWKNCEIAAEEMIPIIGQLYREKSVEISVLGQLLVKRGVTAILKAHDTVHQIGEYDLTPVDTMRILKRLVDMPVKSAHIDIGKLYVKYRGLTDEITPHGD